MALSFGNIFTSYGGYSSYDVPPGASPTVAFLASRGVGLDAANLNQTFASRLAAAVAAGEKATGQKADFASFYRTHEEQAQIKANSLGRPVAYQGKTYQPKPGITRGFAAAYPGNSMHERGMAADFKGGSEAVRNWVEAHARDYGLSSALRSQSFGYDIPHVQLDLKAKTTPYDGAAPALAYGEAGGAKSLAPSQITAAREAAGQAPASVLRNGNTGPAVRALQQKLQAAGYSVGQHGADSIFGHDTAAALKQFQAGNGLNPDGVAGPLTQNKLLQFSAPAAPKPPAPPAAPFVQPQRPTSPTPVRPVPPGLSNPVPLALQAQAPLVTNRATPANFGPPDASTLARMPPAAAGSGAPASPVYSGFTPPPARPPLAGNRTVDQSPALPSSLISGAPLASQRTALQTGAPGSVPYVPTAPNAMGLIGLPFAPGGAAPAASSAAVAPSAQAAPPAPRGLPGNAPYGADRILKAALTGDPTAVKSAMDAVTKTASDQLGFFGGMLHSGDAKASVQKYLTDAVKQNPDIAAAVRNQFNINPQMAAVLPPDQQAQLRTALAGPPPLPPQRPAGPVAAPAQVAQASPPPRPATPPGTPVATLVGGSFSPTPANAGSAGRAAPPLSMDAIQRLQGPVPSANTPGDVWQRQQLAGEVAGRAAGAGLPPYSRGSFSPSPPPAGLGAEYSKLADQIGSAVSNAADWFTNPARSVPLPDVGGAVGQGIKTAGDFLKGLPGINQIAPADAAPAPQPTQWPGGVQPQSPHYTPPDPWAKAAKATRATLGSLIAPTSVANASELPSGAGGYSGVTSLPPGGGISGGPGPIPSQPPASRGDFLGLGASPAAAAPGMSGQWPGGVQPQSPHYTPPPASPQFDRGITPASLPPATLAPAGGAIANGSVTGLSSPSVPFGAQIHPGYNSAGDQGPSSRTVGRIAGGLVGGMAGPAGAFMGSRIGAMFGGGGRGVGTPYSGALAGGGYANGSRGGSGAGYYSPWSGGYSAGGGGYMTPGGSNSNSPFTPVGWTPPSFDPVSGGPTYAYQANGNGGGSYITSFGNAVSY